MNDQVNCKKDEKLEEKDYEPFKLPKEIVYHNAKWGCCRYFNRDGTLNDEGKKCFWEMIFCRK